jgi:lysozyme family protein
VSLADIRLRDPTAAYAIARTLPLEGGLVDDPRDPGGVTNRGVSLRYALAQVAADADTRRWFDIDHDGVVDRRDIAGLTPDVAANIYFNGWWLTGWYGRLTPASIAWKCFDIAVNTGPKRAALILQKSLQALGADIAVDAVVGPQTIAATGAEAARDQGAALLAEIRDQQADYYRALAASAPELKPFLRGWLNRAAA